MKYKIIIELDTKQVQKLYEGNVWYNDTKFDYAIIYNNRIEILLERKKQINVENVLVNHNSSMTKQINKCMAFLYATTTTQPRISKIKICKEGEDIYEYSNINNPIMQFNKNVKFTDKELTEMFSNKKEKAEAMTISLIFLLKGSSEKEEGERFENYWKSFNSLYTFISQEKKEKDKLYYMRHFICSNKNRFQQSLNLLDGQTKKDIRSIRIRDLILNDFPSNSYEDTRKFKDFVLRYTDYRMNEVFFECLVYREANLKREAIYEEVINSIQQNITSRKKENLDLLCFYILRYSYYLRNKYFHAEKLTPTFNFVKNKENIELERINELLQLFLCELIKCNDLY